MARECSIIGTQIEARSTLLASIQLPPEIGLGLPILLDWISDMMLLTIQKLSASSLVIVMKFRLWFTYLNDEMLFTFEVLQTLKIIPLMQCRKHPWVLL
jgi:hypothetical protein